MPAYRQKTTTTAMPVVGPLAFRYRIWDIIDIFVQELGAIFATLSEFE